VRVVPLATALEWLSDGRIHAVTTVVALQWLALHRARLEERWTRGAAG
jgi:hypothetical protein